MTKVLDFSVHSDSHPKKNLEAFVNFCRNQLHLPDGVVAWEDTYWKGVGIFGQTRGKSGSAAIHSGANNPFTKPFADFAKAYIRYQELNAISACGGRFRLMALRVIEDALIKRKGSSDVTMLDRGVLDEAATTLTTSDCSESKKVGVITFLREISKFTRENQLVVSDIGDWIFKMKLHQRITSSIGTKGDIARQACLPDDAISSAIAEIFFNNPNYPSDVFTTSTCALLMCQPGRISEVLSLEVGCFQQDVDSEGRQYHFLRNYISLKRYGVTKKGIPSLMVDTAKEALRRLENLSEPGRKLAEHIEINPTKFYRHDDCPDVEEDDVLSPYQACKALGLARAKTKSRTQKEAAIHSLEEWLNRHGHSCNTTGHTLRSLWAIVMEKQAYKPDKDGKLWLNKQKGIRLKDSLFCYRAWELDIRLKTRRPSPVFLWVANSEALRRRITISNHESHTTIFYRHNYKDAAGNPLSVRSHQFRHWLNTLCQKNGVSQEYIAMWSGRKNIEQNHVYNQMSTKERLALVINATAQSSSSAGDQIPSMPKTHEEFEIVNQRYAGSLHVTDYGYCVQDFAMSPCELYGDCDNCTHQVCVKGDEKAEQRLRQRFTLVEKQLLAAEREIEEGTKGADRWYEYHKKTAERLRERIAIIDDQNTPPGAFFRLKNGGYSVHGARAINAVKEHTILQETEITSSLKQKPIE